MDTLIHTGKAIVVQELNYEAEPMEAVPELDSDSVIQRYVIV